MQTRFRLIRRGSRGGTFYCVDSATGKRTSLGKVSREEAEEILLAKNRALRQPALNVSIARAYLAASDTGIGTRTWQTAFEQVMSTKAGPTLDRWKRVAADRALAPLWKMVIVETRPEHFLSIVSKGTVSTNVYLRRLHSFALDMGFLPWPLLHKRQWPRIKYGERRAITPEEHRIIVAGEPNSETRSYYELLWHLGGSQTDVAMLSAEATDWTDRILTYRRGKTGTTAQVHLGEQTAALLAKLPRTGPLFPRLAQVDEKHRAKQFKRRCIRLGIHGISLHSYRYAWAERAKEAGYPERFAQQALGHASKAVHRAYAKKAPVRVPSLEEYETKGRGLHHSIQS